MITRRQFCKAVAIGIAGTSVAPVVKFGSRAVLASNLKSRVVTSMHTQMIDSSERINAVMVRTVLDETLVALTNTASIKDAWMQIFPGLQSTDTICIKVNCVERRLPSHPEVVYALAQSLVDALGVNPNQFLIWDRSDRELKRAKYTLNKTGEGIQCFGNVEKFSMLDWAIHNIPDTGIGYDQQAMVEVGNDKQVSLSNILTRQCTYLINVPVLKDHNRAGVTLSLKNHYGSISEPWLCHDGNCDPYLANLNSTPQIRDKTRLIVCDALFGMYRGGPQGAPQWMNRQLLASTDPVALDATGLDIINQQRQEHKIRVISKQAQHINTAARLGLGTDDPQKMESIALQLG